MIYYIDTIEQTKKDDKVNEYGKREQWKLTLHEVESKYFKKLSDVSNDLIEDDPSKNHYYMDIRIVDTTGGVIRKDTVGKMQEVQTETSK